MSKPLVITVAGRKGGTGKTTISCGIASIWHQMGKRVLVVDIDPQANATFALNVQPGQSGTAGLLLDGTPPVEPTPNLFVCSGGPELEEASIERLHPEDLADILDKAPVDVVVCDCPPGNEHLERLAVTAADVCLIVADAHPFAAVGASRVINNLEDLCQRGRRGPKNWLIVMSKIDIRRSADRRMTDHAEEEFPSIERLEVRVDAALAKATGRQELIAEAAPKCRGVEDLKTIVEWIHGKVEGQGLGSSQASSGVAV